MRAFRMRLIAETPAFSSHVPFVTFLLARFDRQKEQIGENEIAHSSRHAWLRQKINVRMS
jgi:hypothetical protein